MDTDRSAHLGGDGASVVVTMTPLQARSLAILIARSHPGTLDSTHWGESFRILLPRWVTGVVGGSHCVRRG